MGTTEAASAPLQTPIETRLEFIAALHDAIHRGVACGARRMVFVDGNFADWPLEDPALLLRLGYWLRQPQRQLVLLAADFDDLRRRRSRFVAWYRLWSHAVQACSPAPDEVADLPSVLWVERTALVVLLDATRWRGWAVADPVQQRPWGDRIDAILQRSAPAFPATTLGL